MQFVQCEDSGITNAHRSIQGFLRCQNVSQLGRFKKSSACWRFQDVQGGANGVYKWSMYVGK